jgi:putative membrane protein
LRGAIGGCDNRPSNAPAASSEHAMSLVANVLIVLIALLHLWFLILEMFLWTRPSGRRAFGLSEEFAEQSRALAANQGLYNGFLAVGLLWGVWLGAAGFAIKVFFLGCVLAAGVFGGLTAARKILWFQALPAAVALLLVLA